MQLRKQLVESNSCSSLIRRTTWFTANSVERQSQTTSSGMLRKIPQSKLEVSEPNPSWFGNQPNETNPKWTNKNWLMSRFHFSFAEYSNHRNTGFGVLRVMNDDLVQPDRGFSGHPHRDTEICTYIVDGKLSHKDSMGTEETLGRGSIQFMTAGKGVTHSEHNRDTENPLRFIQIWINTRTRGLEPKYGSYTGEEGSRRNKWAHLVSDVQDKEITPIKINQDANIHISEVDAGNTVTMEIKGGRQAYLLCMEGSCCASILNKKECLQRHDAAELVGPMILSITPSSGDSPSAHMLIVEMKFNGDGRTDL